MCSIARYLEIYLTGENRLTNYDGYVEYRPDPDIVELIV
jgi:hypothetical protein